MKNPIFKGFSKQHPCGLHNLTSHLYNHSYKLGYNFRLQKIISSFLLACASLSHATASHASFVDINELHYDNTGADISEGVELVGVSGTSLVDWSLAFYNGNDGKVYKTITLNETLGSSSTSEFIGFLHIPVSGLQNGPADGVALIDALGNTLRFLSYEGVVVASNGPASGQSSSDIVASETGTGAIGTSLQRIGDINWDGSTLSFSNLNWQSTISSWGSINPIQTVTITDPALSPVPVPPSALLFASALGATALTQRRRKHSKYLVEGKINREKKT